MACRGAVFLLLGFVSLIRAQDTFEIQVYEYDTVPKGMWNLETHINYVGQGTKTYEGTVAPTNNQFHLTYELTRGITDYFEMAGYLVLAHRPGSDALEYVAWRARPRVRLPKSWHLPVDISMSGEVGFPRKAYEEASTTLELRPIVEKIVGKWQFDVNPTVGRALRGLGPKDWDFEPGVRVAYAASKFFEPSLEYYGATGPVFGPLPRSEQAHLFYPGCDLHFSENVVWNLGIGVAATPAGNQLTYKMRIGWLFAKPRSPAP